MARSNNCLLSIIVPVYNGRETIQRTIDSIRNSILHDKEVELIFVNDGSKDSTLTILKSNKDNFSNFVLVNQENQGVSSARNSGLGIATGEYVYFMDADDELSVDFYSCIREQLYTKPEVLVFGYKRRINDEEMICLPQKCHVSLLESYLKGFTKINIWSLIIKRDLLLSNSIRFNENTSYGEDKELILRVLHKTSSVSILPRALYEYNDNPGSAMNKSFSSKRMTSVDAMGRIVEMLINEKAPRRIVRSAINYLLVDYNLILNRFKLTVEQKRWIKGKYKSIDRTYPPFQFTKFYFYNFYCYLKRCIIK